MRETIFPETHEWCEEKLLGKNRLNKVQHIIFYIHTNIVFKKGTKNARNNFSRNIRIVLTKNVRRKIVGKSAKKRFLYSHEYRDQYKGTKNARNNFSRNTLIVRAKMFGKKSSVKSANKRFLIHTNIVTKKWRGKNARRKFSRNTRIVRGKNVGKNRRKKCEKTFFIFTRIS